MKGLEFDWQTQFSYLPGFLKGFILNTNVTFMQSKTRYPYFSYKTTDVFNYNEAGKRIAPFKVTKGQQDSRLSKIEFMPDIVGNIALGYEIGGFSGRVSAYYQSTTTTAAQSPNVTIDQSKAELWRFDIQLSQKIRKVEGLSFYLNIRNLTDNPDRTVLTHHEDLIRQDERYGAEGDLGVRYKF